MILTKWNSVSKDIKIADFFFEKKIQKEFLCTELLLISNGDMGYIIIISNSCVIFVETRGQ